MTVRESAHDTRAPPDLAQDALERVRVIGANPPPLLLWERVVGESLLDRRYAVLPIRGLLFMVVQLANAAAAKVKSARHRPIWCAPEVRRCRRDLLLCRSLTHVYQSPSAR